MSEKVNEASVDYPGLTIDGNKPFTSRRAAESAMKQQGIRTYQIIEVDGGFAVRTERFWRVMFQAKASPNDPEDVMLSVNGETLIIAREKEVIIPDRYKEAADHAVYAQFRQMPGQPRKVIGHVRVFPYIPLGPATEAEYIEQKAKGTANTKAMVNKYGHDVNPDSVPELQA